MTIYLVDVIHEYIIKRGQLMFKMNNTVGLRKISRNIQKYYVKSWQNTVQWACNATNQTVTFGRRKTYAHWYNTYPYMDSKHFKVIWHFCFSVRSFCIMSWQTHKVCHKFIDLEYSSDVPRLSCVIYQLHVSILPSPCYKFHERHASFFISEAQPMTVHNQN